MLDFFFRTSGVRLNLQVLEGGFNFTASVSVLHKMTSSVRLFNVTLSSVRLPTSSARLIDFRHRVLDFLMQTVRVLDYISGVSIIFGNWAGVIFFHAAGQVFDESSDCDKANTRSHFEKKSNTRTFCLIYFRPKKCIRT